MSGASTPRSAIGPHRVTVVERTANHVDYIEVRDESPEVPAAWSRLEGIVGDLRGRHFVGAFTLRTGRYRACVEVDAASPRLDDLDHGELAGGLYARIRLRGDPSAGLYTWLPAAFQQLLTCCAVDDNRHCLELYRRHDHIDALVPIRYR
jgi:hypothetical protein